MSIKKSNHKANIKNSNKGTTGTNVTYAKNQGNRGKQLNTTSNNANTKISKPSK